MTHGTANVFDIFTCHRLMPKVALGYWFQFHAHVKDMTPLILEVLTRTGMGDYLLSEGQLIKHF